MGIIRFFRSLANPKVLGEEIIDSIEPLSKLIEFSCQYRTTAINRK
jgi:hypothetical protein